MATTGFTNLRVPSSQELDKRVLIGLCKDKPVGNAELEREFANPKARWARIQPVGTVAYAEGVGTDHHVTHRIKLRLLNGLTRSHEIVHGANVYRVLRSAPLDGGNDFTIVDVEQLK